MPVVLLVRHGQASAHGEDYDVLSELGARQAAVVREELLRRQLREPVVLSGSLRRQRDTASIALPGPCRVDPRWDEYDHLALLRDFGADLSPEQGIQPMLDQALNRWIADGTGWATFAAARRAALDDLVGSLPSGKDAVVVTSGGVIAALTADLLGTGPAAVVPLNRVAVNGAITTVLAGRRGLSLASFNDHAHLTGANAPLLTYR